MTHLPNITPAIVVELPLEGLRMIREAVNHYVCHVRDKSSDGPLWDGLLKVVNKIVDDYEAKCRAGIEME